ncbi:MAG: diacylglycerol kinase family lipid kinase [Candidatus Aminicenantes bacterium]|nr:diacylglycerol kinase family lipid kinase [Candidatus Aminicenantes bacterium]
MPERARTLLVVNPAAGHGLGRKTFDRLEPRLRESFPGLEIRLSEYPGHAVELGRRASGEGFARLLCLGGDGTPFEVVNGLYADGRPPLRPEIGLIPAGTGNSFIRDFGVTAAEEALANIVAGRRRAVDLVEFEHRREGRLVTLYSLNILGVGLIADILKLTNERLKFLGSAGYSLAVLLRLAKGMDNQIDFQTDGRKWTVRDSAFVVSNSKYTGGKMKIAPSADVADGKADLVVFREVNRREIIAIFKGVFSGKHAAHPKVEIHPAAEIRVEADPPLRVMADGELLGETPLRLRVLPRELPILA